MPAGRPIDVQANANGTVQATYPQLTKANHSSPACFGLVGRYNQGETLGRTAWLGDKLRGSPGVFPP